VDDHAPDSIGRRLPSMDRGKALSSCGHALEARDQSQCARPSHVRAVRKPAHAPWRRAAEARFSKWVPGTMRKRSSGSAGWSPRHQWVSEEKSVVGRFPDQLETRGAHSPNSWLGQRRRRAELDPPFIRRAGPSFPHVSATRSTGLAN